jgi:hypothetical protein
MIQPLTHQKQAKLRKYEKRHATYAWQRSVLPHCRINAAMQY